MPDFRPPRADDQGDESPPPGPPTLFPVFRFEQRMSVLQLRYQPFNISGGEKEPSAGKRFGEPLTHP
jgi:hypothetical protein